MLLGQASREGWGRDPCLIRGQRKRKAAFSLEGLRGFPGSHCGKELRRLVPQKWLRLHARFSERIWMEGGASLLGTKPAMDNSTIRGIEPQMQSRLREVINNLYLSWSSFIRAWDLSATAISSGRLVQYLDCLPSSKKIEPFLFPSLQNPIPTIARLSIGDGHTTRVCIPRIWGTVPAILFLNILAKYCPWNKRAKFKPSRLSATYQTCKKTIVMFEETQKLVIAGRVDCKLLWSEWRKRLMQLIHGNTRGRFAVPPRGMALPTLAGEQDRDAHPAFWMVGMWGRQLNPEGVHWRR